MQLVAALAVRHGVSLDSTEIIAKTGWTADELADGIAAAAPAGPFNLVSLLVGVNNQYRARRAGQDMSVAVREFSLQLDALLAQAVGFAGGTARRVLVVSIPDWGATPFARTSDPAPATCTESIAAQVNLFNSCMRGAADKHGATFIDITGASRAAATDPRLTAPDGLHPSGAQYAVWVELMEDAAAAAATLGGACGGSSGISPEVH